MRQSKAIIIFSHIIGWVLLFVLVIAFTTGTPGGQPAWNRITEWNFLLFYFIYVFSFYINSGVFIPMLYLKKQHILYFICIVFLLAAVIWIRPFDRLLSPEMAPPKPPPFRPERNHPPGGGKPGIDIVSIVLFIMVWSFSTAVQTIRQWRTTERRALQAETDKVNAELLVLKAQINPHFLFNTLNNIYSMAISKSENTAEAIMKLSNIMRYVTDEVDTDFVSLQKELDCAADYIDLQKLRLNEKVHVDFSINGNAEGKRIAPLLLITFIENVFKYGISTREETEIVIKIEIQDLSFRFFCMNKIFMRNTDLERTGIGIENTKKRLQHLYPNTHQLSITTEGAHYTVELKLQLQ